MDNYVIEVTDTSNEVITINDWYDNSDLCKCVVPIPETEVLDYIIAEDVTEDPSTIYHNVSYAV